MMRADHINAFIVATKELMEVMVGIEDFSRSHLAAEERLNTSHDVSAVIGLAGDCVGAVVLSFSTEIALKMLTRIMGEDIDHVDDAAKDVVAEMVNIIAGNAATQLRECGCANVNRAVPGLVTGSGHRVNLPKSVPCINIHFETDLGDFAMQVSFRIK